KSRPPSVSIGESSPNRRTQQLRRRKRTHENRDDERTTAHLPRIERQQWDDHQQSHHVDEVRDDQHEQLAARYSRHPTAHRRRHYASALPSAAGGTALPTTPAS